ncbi:MAG: alpha/beta fold hydrolase [Chloroflexi bacterium]|nr:alpha/beta fold hydrolase [Chloroflexota bacterium]
MALETTTREALPLTSQARPLDCYLEVEGLRLRYWDKGEGPPLLLIHGFGACCEYWQNNFTALAQHFRTIALDLPGHGYSEMRIPDYSLPSSANFLASFLDALHVEKASVVGKSMGGALALALGVYQPSRVNRLVLVNSAGLGREIALSFRLLAVPILRDILTIRTRLGMKLWQKSLAHRKAVINDEWVELAYRMGGRPGRRQIILSLARSGLDLGGQRPAVWESLQHRLSEIKTPTLIIWGAKDAVIPVSHAYNAARLIPQAQLHVFENCGHLTQIEVAEEFNQLLINFLQSPGGRK